MNTIAVRGTELYVQEAGAGPALLFVHGVAGDADVWHDMVSRLADRFRCVSYDRRGYSRSPMGDAPEEVGTHAEDAAALIRELEIEPVVIGSGSGARVAVELGRRHPYLLAGEVFAEPPIVTLDPDAGRVWLTELAGAVRPAVEADDPVAAVNAFFSTFAPDFWAAIDEPARERYRANGSAFLAELTAPTYDLRPNELAAVDLPALVLTGENSHPALHALAAALADNLPDVRRVELPGAGHVTYGDRPAEFARVVAEFADEAADSALTSPR